MPKRKKPKTAQRKPAQRRSRESVAVIVEAAAQVLLRHGYRGATTNRIAERAGVSIGTLYQYFRNKDDIFNALIEKEAASYLDALAGATPGPEVPHREAIRSLLEAGYAHHRLVLSLTEVMTHVPSTVYAKQSREIRSELHKLVVKFLETRGPIPGLDDLSLAADLLIAQSEGLTFLGRIQRSPDELIEILTESSTRYLLGDK